MNISRRSFVGAGAAMFAAAGCKSVMGPSKDGKLIAGFEQTESRGDVSQPWEPYSDRKVRIAIAGEGVCSFGSAFGYQDHPNAEVIACTDLDPAKCAKLQQRVRAKRTYASCEELLEKEKEIDAIYIATDAPSHFRLATKALQRGLHVVSAVPALFGIEQLDMIPDFLAALKKSGCVYQMNETSAYHADLYAMRKIYEAGYMGEIVYAEGEYFHSDTYGKLDSLWIPSYNNWRLGLPPQYYPTHSNAYYTCVTHKRFTEVSCAGVPSLYKYFQAANNRYKNPFGSEIALFRGEEGAAVRMCVTWVTPSRRGEEGRVWGQKGSFEQERFNASSQKLRKADPTRPTLKADHYEGWFEKEVYGLNLLKPQLPPQLKAGHHGGSSGYLTEDFLKSILVKGHKPCVDAVTALNTTVAGIYAHMSAMKGGETLKIPSFA